MACDASPFNPDSFGRAGCKKFQTGIWNRYLIGFEYLNAAVLLSVGRIKMPNSAKFYNAILKRRRSA